MHVRRSFFRLTATVFRLLALLLPAASVAVCHDSWPGTDAYSATASNRLCAAGGCEAAPAAAASFEMPAVPVPEPLRQEPDTAILRRLAGSGSHLPVASYKVRRDGRMTVHRLDNRVHRGRDSWERLIPTHAKLQYAGGIGFMSAGFGWDYGPRCQWETDLMVGVVPAYNAKDPKMTLTLKQNWMPWGIRCGERFAVEPFACGIYLSTILSDRFWVREPDRYPKHYYPIATRLRAHLFVGQRVTWNTSLRRERLVRRITAYYELSTCDIYLISKVGNRWLRLSDILGLSFGVKFQFY